MSWIVAWHEFKFTITKKSFYLVTLGMPLLVLAYMGMVGLMVAATAPGEFERISRPVGLIDQSGLLTDAEGALADAKIGEIFEFEIGQQDSPGQPEPVVPNGFGELTDIAAQSGMMDLLAKRKVVLFDDVADAQPQLADESIGAVIVVPDDYVESGKFQVYSKRSSLLGSTIGVGWLSNLIADRLLDETELSVDQIDRIRNSPATDEFEINSDGQFESVDSVAKILSLGLPLAVSGLLVLALIMNASLLLASIAEEKENKVMEVILSSVSADDLLFGKVLGIVMAGLLQIGIWLAMVSVIPALTMLMVGQLVDYEVNMVQLAMSVIYMLVGFVFYGGLLAGLGSLGSSYKDCQQLSAVVIVCACIPLMLMTAFITNPDGIAPRILSWVPLFSPIGMSMRLAATEVPWWEVVGSLTLLVFSTWAATKIAARLFRAGTLMRGKAPSIGQIWKVMVGTG